MTGVQTCALPINDTPNSYNANFSSGTSYTGAGVTIGIGGDALILGSTVAAYRSRFLSGDTTQPTITNVDGSAVEGNNSDEAYIDTELSGGLAPGATIHFYTASDSDGGIQTAIEQMLTDNTVDIFSLSFGACELDLGTSNNQLINGWWQQAATAGITVTVSSGDSGSAGCDNPNTENSAIDGLQVSGLSSTPYNISVGGSDFYGLLSSFSTYVGNGGNAANNYRSALSYIPESPWNDSTTNNAGINANVENGSAGSTNIVSGGGGMSACSVNTTGDMPGTCISGYPKPSWQAGTGVPNDGARDVPDLSLMAGNGYYDATWLICTDDTGTVSGVTVSANCEDQSNGYFYFVGYGGTSTSAPAFAGMLALVEQAVGGRLGMDANQTLYQLFNGSNGSAVFHDITQGNNSVVCTSGTPNCAEVSSGDYFLTGYPTTTGYDLATGLGSVDATNLVNNWASAMGAGTPPISLSATSLSYGDQDVSTTSASQSVTLTNTGSAKLAISSIAVTGTDASSFVFANNCGSSLAVGASCTIHGHFTPTTTGALTAAVTITDNASGSPQSISLSGTGVSPTTVSLSSTSLSFGYQEVSTTSASQSVTLTNTGSSILAITSIAAAGTGASSFVFANNCGSSLAVDASCTIHGHFTPTTTGALTAAITITDTATGSPQNIALSGTGVNPTTVSLSSTSLSFGDQQVSTTSASQSVTLTDTGSATLEITSIAVTGTGASSFVFANNCGSSLAVDASCTIHGHFTPTTTGALTAAITMITANAPGSPQIISLSGTGVNPTTVSLSSISLSYGDQVVSTASASQSVILTNTGSAILAITSIAVTGTDASSFVFANNCGSSLAVAASCTIHGHFTPTATGASTAAITITDNASGSPQIISLSGTGVNPTTVSLSSISLSYGDQVVSTASASQSVILTNTGSAILAITSIAVTGTDASSFVFANNCGSSLAVAASCTIHGHFTPTATGASTAAITITDNASGSPQSIALSGTGQ